MNTPKSDDRDPYARYEACVAELYEGNIRHRSKAQRMGATSLSNTSPTAFIKDALEAFACSWWENPSTTTKKNWQWRPSERRYSASKREVALERNIVKRCGLDRWTFQMSTMSGLVDGRKHKRRSIDLVHQVDEDRYDFIELKTGSDNPVYAAFEILGYGLAYCRARQYGSLHGGSGRHDVMQARAVQLVVLAPRPWYQYKARRPPAIRSYEVARLTSFLNAGLSTLPSELKLKGLDSLGFEFRMYDDEPSLMAQVTAGESGGSILG
jgi:hypothetical protein